MYVNTPETSNKYEAEWSDALFYNFPFKNESDPTCRGIRGSAFLISYLISSAWKFLPLSREL